MKDLEVGTKSEIEVLPVLQQYFKNTTINKISNAYSCMDYKGKNSYYELKTRNNNYNKYPTTIIGYNKVKYILNVQNQTDFYFVFRFTDGIYYYKYDPNDKFEIKIGGRSDRGFNEFKDYYHIPIEKLILII